MGEPRLAEGLVDFTMATEPDTAVTAHGGQGFLLELRSRALFLTVDPEEWRDDNTGKDDVYRALNDFPVDVYSSDLVSEALHQHNGIPVEIGRLEIPGGAGIWEVKLAPSRMFAYVVPGAAGGQPENCQQAVAAISAEGIREKLAELGVTTGILEDVLEQIGRDEKVEDIMVVARGLQPVRSSNARVEFLFSARANTAPVERSDGSVDFHDLADNICVNEGDILARRHPPEPGSPGLDVLGTTVPVPPAIDRPLGPVAGKGTEVRGDDLVAGRPGRPVFNGTRVEVLPVFEVKGDVNYAVGNIRFNGDVTVTGDVQAGFIIEAEGSVTVRGIVERSSISAGKDVAVRGVIGDGQCSIHAGGSLTAQYIHNMQVTVGGELVVNRELVGCTVTARKVQTSPNGRIVGGEVVACQSVTAGTIGSPQAVPTQVSVVENSDQNPAVIRAARAIHARTTVRLGHCLLKVVDDLPGSSFWISEGDIARLGPAASPPKAA